MNITRHLLLALLLVSIFALNSCTSKDYYNEANNSGSNAGLFSDSLAVSGSFNWSTTKSINLSVAVDDQYNGQYFYRVDVYDQNPLYSQDAKLLGSGVAKKGADFASSIVATTATEVLYVKQTDPTGLKSVSAVALTNDSTAEISFAAKPSTSTLKSSLLKSVSTVSEVTMPTINVPSTPGSAEAFAGKLENGKSYLIPAGTTYSGSIANADWTAGGTLYIDGTWTVPSNIFVIYYNVVVHNGGKIVFSNSNTTFTSRGSLTVAKGGEISGNPTISLENNNVYVANYGTINANVVAIAGGSTMYNYNVLNTAELKSQNNSTYDIYNSGELQAGILNPAGTGSLYNYNKITATTIESQNTTGYNFYNYSNGVITTTTFQLPGRGGLYNYNKVTASVITSQNNSNTTINNEGSINTGTLTFSGSGGVINNNCHLVASGQISLRGAVVNIAGGGLVSGESLDVANTNFNLSSSAMLSANTTTFRNAGTTFIYGTGSAGKALFKSPTINYESYNNTIFTPSGNLVVYATTITNSAPTTNLPSNGATFVNEASASPTINSTLCNNGGNNDTPYSGVPTNQVFPIIYEGTGLTYLFEDNWPYLGDFDMNDVVLDVTPTYSVNSSNKISQIVLNVKLRAVGATRSLAVGLQLDGISSSNISSVTRTNTQGINGSVFSQSGNLETGQTLAVIPLFDEAHLALGISDHTKFINTLKSATTNVDPLTVSFTIAFKTPVDKSNISVDRFNPFVVNGGTIAKRQEIHMPGFAPTDKANTAKFGFGDDNSLAGKKYTSKVKNLIWALAVPAGTAYPKEWTSISKAYPEMEDWATKGGISSMSWYKTSLSGSTY